MVNDFKIIDTAGASLPANGVGEIVVRGPNVAEGYIPLPPRAALTDADTTRTKRQPRRPSHPTAGSARATLATSMTAAGSSSLTAQRRSSFVEARTCASLNSSPWSVLILCSSTITVENALYSDERVKEAAVVPLKDYMLGELVGAIVTVKEAHRSDPPTEESLTALVRSLLPKHCTPVMVIISYGEILRNVNGKIMKKELKVELNKVWEERNKGTKAVAKL